MKNLPIQWGESAMLLRILMTVLLMAISISWAYGNEENDIREGLFIDGEDYIGPYLANTSEDPVNTSEDLVNTSEGNYTGNLSNNSSDIREGLFIDAEGYIGPYLTNNSSNNLSDMNSSSQADMIYPEIDSEDLNRDLGFNEGFFGDLPSIMGKFESFRLNDFFDGRGLQH
jgi:hypothetical protein